MDIPLVPTPQSQMCMLQGRWYQRLVECLQQTPSMFQLTQAGQALTSDEHLWSYLNIVPPRALTFNEVLRRAEKFFDEYAAIIGQINFPESQFASDIGQANYVAWTAYLNQLSPVPTPQQLPGLFQNWAMRHGAANVVSQGVADLTQMAMIATAKQALEPYQGSNPRPVDYAGSLSEVNRLLSDSPAGLVVFDDGIEVNATPAWAGDNDDGIFGLWSGSDPRSRISQRFAQAQVSVQAKLGSYALWTAAAGPWYNSSLLNSAYSNRTSPPWTEGGTPNWGEMFGPRGALRYAVANVLVADTAEVTVLCDAEFHFQDQIRILEHVARGVWPFYLPSGAGAFNNVSFEGGRLKLTTQTKAGHPFVIGSNVLDITRYLGHGNNPDCD